MPKSFMKSVQEGNWGSKVDVLNYIHLHDQWECEDKFGYCFYPTIEQWYETNRPQTPQLVVRAGDTPKTTWLREFLKVYGEAKRELAEAQAELENIRVRNRFLEDQIKQRNSIEEGEILQFLPLLSR